MFCEEYCPGTLITYTGVGFCTLPSDYDRAMREASGCRTVTDTDSYAFPLYKPIQRRREDDRGNLLLMNVSSSFYDGLNKFVIGFLLIIPFINPCNGVLSYISDNTLELCVFCWLVGIFFWAFQEYLILRFLKFLPFLQKNNIKWIRDEYHNVSKETGKNYKDDCGNDIKIIEEKHYFSIYYEVQKKGLLGAVPILESYSAFFYNLSFVFLWWMIAMGIHSVWPSCCCVATPCKSSIYIIIVLIFAIIASLYFRACIEKKIFKAIFDAYFLGVL